MFERWIDGGWFHPPAEGTDHAGIGTRGLRSILEETLLDVQFELPSRGDVQKCVVTKETIEKGQRPMLVTDATGEHDVVGGDEALGEQTA